MDIELQPSPELNDENNSVVFQYLRDVSCDSTFAQSVLSVLIEERREYHQNRMNKSKCDIPFKVGDAVKAHVQVQSNSASGTVKKLSYQAKGPFIITKVLDHGSYEVQQYNDPSSKKRKYKSSELYLTHHISFQVKL